MYKSNLNSQKVIKYKTKWSKVNEIGKLYKQHLKTQLASPKHSETHRHSQSIINFQEEQQLDDQLMMNSAVGTIHGPETNRKWCRKLIHDVKRLKVNKKQHICVLIDV